MEKTFYIMRFVFPIIGIFVFLAFVSMELFRGCTGARINGELFTKAEQAGVKTRALNQSDLANFKAALQRSEQPGTEPEKKENTK
jgi:hypothetical protein